MVGVVSVKRGAPGSMRMFFACSRSVVLPAPSSPTSSKPYCCGSRDRDNERTRPGSIADFGVDPIYILEPRPVDSSFPFFGVLAGVSELAGCRELLEGRLGAFSGRKEPFRDPELRRDRPEPFSSPFFSLTDPFFDPDPRRDRPEPCSGFSGSASGRSDPFLPPEPCRDRPEPCRDRPEPLSARSGPFSTLSSRLTSLRDRTLLGERILFGERMRSLFTSILGFSSFSSSCCRDMLLFGPSCVPSPSLPSSSIIPDCTHRELLDSLPCTWEVPSDMSLWAVLHEITSTLRPLVAGTSFSLVLPTVLNVRPVPPSADGKRCNQVAIKSIPEKQRVSPLHPTGVAHPTHLA